MAETVVGSGGTPGSLLRCNAKSVGEYAEQENWKRQKTKEVGRKFDRKTCVLQETAQSWHGITPRVTRQYVFARPEPLVSRNGDVHPPSGNGESIDFGQETGVVADVLDNVEQAHRWKSLRQHPSILQGPPHHLTYTALQCISNPGKSRFDEDHFQPGLLYSPRHVTIPAANIEKRPGWWEDFNRFEDTAISVPKPKRRVFHREAKLVPFLRV